MYIERTHFSLTKQIKQHQLWLDFPGTVFIQSLFNYYYLKPSRDLQTYRPAPVSQEGDHDPLVQKSSDLHNLRDR